jgi:prepilin-type N-terminal cleavage/methylation domain-containing protein
MNRRRGFSLIETLLAISLLGVFMLIAFRLVVANTHIAAATMVADGNSAKFEGAINTLRADVTGSCSIEMPFSTVLNIHGPGQQTVEWRSDQNFLSRSNGKDTRSWNIGRPINLKLDGAIVLITANPGDHIAMASIHPGGTR